LAKAVSLLDSLEVFSPMYSKRVEGIKLDFAERQQRLWEVGIDEKRVRSFAQHKEAMQEALDQAHMFADALDAQSRRIVVAVEKAEANITSRQEYLNEVEEELVWLEEQLRKAQE
jgi:hypothetical protein